MEANTLGKGRVLAVVVAVLAAVVVLPAGRAAAVTPTITTVFGAVHPGFSGPIDVNGANFEAGVTVTFPAGITATIVGTPTTSQIKLTVSVAAGVAPGYYNTTVTNPGSPPAVAANTLYVRAVAGQYHAISPQRIVDTRVGRGISGPLNAGGTVDVTVLGAGGVGGVPASGVSAVVLNVTEASATADGYLTVYPTGTGVPQTSTVNFLNGQIVANSAISGVGTGGKVTIYNFAGQTHFLLDVLGYYSAANGQPGSVYVSRVGNDRPPRRIMDTRTGQGTTVGPIVADGTRNLMIADPQFKVRAVALNVTAAESSDAGYLTVYPGGESRPNDVSSVNFTANQAVPNHVIAKVGADGTINVYNFTGTTHSAFDLFGWFYDASLPFDGGSFTAITPIRMLDTRNAIGIATTTPIGADRHITLPINNKMGIPGDVTNVVLNLTAVTPSEGGFLTAWQDSTDFARPNVSTVNFVAGQTVANLGTIRIGSSGAINIYNFSGNTHVLADVVGYYR